MALLSHAMLASRSFSRLGVRLRHTQAKEVSRTTETFSISLPPEMAVELERVRKQEHRTRSELIREALRQYLKRGLVAQSANEEGAQIGSMGDHRSRRTLTVSPTPST